MNRSGAANGQATPSLNNLWPQQQYVDGGEWHAFFAPGSSVVALPGWERPRLLLPACTLASRWHGSGVYPAYRLSAKPYRWLLRLKALSGVESAQVPPSEGDGPTLRDFLADVLPDAQVRAVMMGVAHDAQKLTLQLVGPDGGIVGFVKCAAKPLARLRLANEYRLQCELPPGAGPRPLKYGRIGELDALLMEPVQGRLLQASLPPPADLAAFARSLVHAERRPLDAHPWILGRQLERNVEVQPMLAPLSGRNWEVVWQHGDLVPWNVVRREDGRLAAIDWEFGCRAGFPGLDLAHYVLQVAAHIHRWSAERAREFATRYLLQSGLDASVEESVAIVKLAAYLAFQNGAEEGHATDAPMQRWRRLLWETA